MTFANYLKLKNTFFSRYILHISYFISFVLAASLTFYFENQPVVAALIFAIFFTITFFINHLFYKDFEHSKQALELQNSLFKSSLQNDVLFFLIINNQNNIISYYQSEELGLEGIPINSMDEFSATLKNLNVPSNKIEDIFKFIDSTKDTKLFNQILGPFLFKKINFFITLNALEKYNDYKIIKFFDQRNLNQANENSNQLSIGYYELDKLGYITEANEYFANILGYNTSEIISSSLTLNSLIDIEGSSNELIHDESITDVLKGSWQGLLTLNNKYKEKIHIFIIQKIVFDEVGRFKKIIGYISKLNDQSLIIKLKGVEKGWVDYSWRCFFEESPYPVTILDKYGKILRINSAFEEILPEKIFDKNFIELFADDDQEKIKRQTEAILSKGIKPIPLQVKVKNNNRILDIYMGKILDLSGEIFGFMVRITDITQQNELKESLSHAQRMQTIGHLVGSVAHDFNNILTAIIGFCDLLLMRHTVGDPSFAHIIQIKQSSDRASNLVKRLLAFSRKQTLKLQLVNLNDLFSDFTTLIQRLVGNDIILNQQIDPDIWLVKIDLVQMEQVILNLAVNAHQAMGEGGKLTIKAHNITLEEKDPYLNDFTAPPGETLPPAGQYTAIEVEDTGCGIPQNIIPQIFEPFFTTKTDKSGTGLGLSTVYGIVRQSDGYIYVKSKIGIGTTFLIYLKRQHYSREEIEEVRSLKEAAISQVEIKRDLSGKGVIALIEDEESIRLFAKSALTNKGYEVIEFASAKQALENIKSKLNKIDLIISDVMMPEISGPAMAKEVRKLKPNMKIIFISGYGEEAFTQEYGQSRDFDFIPKPFTLKQLASKVKEVIER